MNKVWLVAWREYRERVTRAPFLISTGLVFLALLALPMIPLLLGQGRAAAPAKILVADRTGGEAYTALRHGLEARAAESAALAGTAAAPPRLSLEPVEAGAEVAAEAQVKKGDASALVVVSGTWPEALQAEYRASGLFALENRGTLEAILTRAAQARRLEASGLDPALLQRVIAPVKLEGVNLSSGDRNRTTEAIRFGLATVAGMLAYIGIIASGAMLFQGVLEEKTSRVVEVLAGSVRPVQMMAGKVLGLGLLSLSQYLTWALGWLFLITFGYSTLGDAVNMATPALMAYLLLYSLLGYLLYAALFAAAGSMISRMEDSATMLLPIMLPLMLPVTLGTFIVQNPDSSLARLLSLIPLFAPSIMLNRLVMGRPAAWEILLSLLLLAGAGAGATWLAGRVYRAALLTYGSRPTLAQVWRYLKS